MNPQSVRVALELQAGQNLVVLAQNENEAKELADSLKEVVAPGNIVAAGFAGKFSMLHVGFVLSPSFWIHRLSLCRFLFSTCHKYC